MPGFCKCGCGGDDCLCQQCCRVVCGQKADWLPVPQRKHTSSGNVCKSCQARYGGPMALTVAGLLHDQKQIWPDSCDVGVVVNANGERRQALRDAVRKLLAGPGWVLDHKWAADGGPRNESWEWRYTAGDRIVVLGWAYCKGVESFCFEIL